MAGLAIVAGLAACLAGSPQAGSMTQQRFEEQLRQSGRSGAVVEVPAWAIGPFRYFTVDGQPGGYADPEGSVAWADGRGAWDVLLLADRPEVVAAGLAGALGAGMIRPLDLQAPELQGRPPAEVGQVHAPTVVRATDGT